MKRKIRWDRVLLIAVALVVVGGTLYGAWESHANYDEYKASVEFWCK